MIRPVTAAAVPPAAALREAATQAIMHAHNASAFSRNYIFGSCGWWFYIHKFEAWMAAHNALRALAEQQEGARDG